MAETDVAADDVRVAEEGNGSLRDALGDLREQRPVLTPAILFGVPIILLIALLAGFTELSPVRILVIGFRVGAVYSLVGLGVALIYKATRVLNFAQGEFGTVSAFIAYAILVSGELGDIGLQPVVARLWWASIVAVAAGAVLAILVNVLVVQRLAEASEVTALVVTVGVALGLTATEVIVFQAQPRPFPRYVSGAACFGPEVAEPGSFALCPLVIASEVVSWHTIISLGVLAVAAALLAAFFRTRVGIALLATAQEPFAAELYGVSVRRMATLAWGLAGALAAIGGLLGAGNFEVIQPGLVTSTFLIPAFVGAILGGITSMVGAVVGGVLVGITVTAANEIWQTYGLTSALPGAPDIAVLVVLLLVLFVRPRGLFGSEA